MLCVCVLSKVHLKLPCGSLSAAVVFHLGLHQHVQLLRARLQVDFFVRQLEQQHEASKARLTPQVRNRRLAQLNRLIDEGARG